MPEAGVLRVEIAEGVATFTLNRPDRRNALNGELVQALRGAFAGALIDPEVRVIVLTGEGRDFCSGADLEELESIADMGPEESLQDASELGELFTDMRLHPRPIIAVVRGRALAGGCGLATACDLVLAEEGAEFGYPEVHLGFVPAMVMAILRRKIGESRAFELVTRGHRISATEALDLGLVARVFPADGFQEAVGAYATDLAGRPPSAVELTKRLLYGLDGVSFQEGIRRGAEVNVVARMTDACREGVRRFLRKAKG